MNYNNSIKGDNNNIIMHNEKVDIIEEKNNKNEKVNIIPTNNDNIKNDISTNIFVSLPSKLEIDYTNNSNNIYESLLIKELLKFHLQNLFCIIKRKKIIIISNIFYHLKKYSKKTIFFLIKSEILYLKITSSIEILSNIYKRKRGNKLYQTLYILRCGNKTNNHLFKIKFEIKYKNEKDNLINENITKLKKLEKEVNEMEDNIKILNIKDNELNLKLNNLSKKEKQLNDTIKQLESSQSSISNNRNTINNISIYESDITSLESTIVNNKQQKEEKQKIINNFIFKVNELLNEYQDYIEILNTNKSSINSTNNNNIKINSSDNFKSNKLSLKIKDKNDS